MFTFNSSVAFSPNVKSGTLYKSSVAVVTELVVEVEVEVVVVAVVVVVAAAAAACSSSIKNKNNNLNRIPRPS